MRCHHIHVEDLKEKVLIPGCWQVAVHGDISFCSCEPTAEQRNAERDTLKELRNEVAYLHKQIKQQNKLIERLRHYENKIK